MRCPKMDKWNNADVQSNATPLLCLFSLFWMGAKMRNAVRLGAACCTSLSSCRPSSAWSHTLLRPPLTGLQSPPCSRVRDTHSRGARMKSLLWCKDITWLRSSLLWGSLSATDSSNGKWTCSTWTGDLLFRSDCYAALLREPWSHPPASPRSSASPTVQQVTHHLRYLRYGKSAVH